MILGRGTRRVLIGVLGLAVGTAASARAQEVHAPPAKIDVMPHAKVGIDPAAEFAKGVVALDAKNYGLAAKALERATKGAPEHYDSWGFLGSARAGLSDWSGSRAAYEQMLRIEPMSAHGHAGLALALVALKDEAGAKLELAWLNSQLKACEAKCSDRVLLQTIVPQLQDAIAGVVPPKPIAADQRLAQERRA